MYSAHDWSSFRETSQSYTLNPFGHNQSVYEQTTASLDLIFYVLVCAGVQTGVSYRVLAMIPHSAARLCNTEVVTVLGGNVVLAMYQQGIGHVCFGVLLLMPVQSLRWEHFLARAVCYKRMHRSVRAEVVVP